MKDIAGDKWELGELKVISTDDLWDWAKDSIVYYRHDYLGLGKCIRFKSEIWFKLGKCMWRKHWSIYQDHLIYVHNDIVNPFCVSILRLVKSIKEMHDLVNYLPPP